MTITTRKVNYTINEAYRMHKLNSMHKFYIRALNLYNCLIVSLHLTYVIIINKILYSFKKGQIKFFKRM